MNKKRRAEIASVILVLVSAKQCNDAAVTSDKIEDAKGDISSILADEQDCLNNVPENLEGSERYDAMENAVDNLEDAIDALDDALSSIEDEDPMEDVVRYIDDAIRGLEQASV